MPVHQRLAQVKHICLGVGNEQDQFDQEPKPELGRLIFKIQEPGIMKIENQILRSKIIGLFLGIVVYSYGQLASLSSLTG